MSGFRRVVRALRVQADRDLVDRCIQLARGLAERDCHYWDGCPDGTRHGRCDACRARKALGLPRSVEGVLTTPEGDAAS